MASSLERQEHNNSQADLQQNVSVYFAEGPVQHGHKRGRAILGIPTGIIIIIIIAAIIRIPSHY